MTGWAVILAIGALFCVACTPARTTPVAPLRQSQLTLTYLGVAGWQLDDGPGTLPLLGSAQGLTWEQKLPGMGPDDARDVLRMIERERGNFIAGPGVRIMHRAGKGDTIVDLPKANISYSDDEGSIDIKVDDGKRNLTVKNAKGEVAFNGPVNTAEDRAKLPAEVSKRLDKLEKDTFNFEVGEDFQSETIPLPSDLAKTKIRHPLADEQEHPAGLRTL